ncbi:hypothetical protein [Massilia endophytica]|uniref:hypothetical protein n=1 Tax=Massilia endophytica TaxID=2899220 RepID=UPI001E580AED|nr:hypothetical protein [Massilia endophytica]UGQ46337.1 hypothetical protein LSQ66_21650 [Massilia endophytica]
MRSALLVLPLLLAACGESYTPEQLYMAATPECRDWQEGSQFLLPRGIKVSATAPVLQADGSLDLGITYMLPRTTQLQFTTRAYNVTEPKGPVIQKAKVVNFYQRATNTRAEMVEVVDGVPGLLIAVASADETQWRVTLRLTGKLPQRFDLVPPAAVIAGERYPVRTFTYRWFEDRKAYGLCR